MAASLRRRSLLTAGLLVAFPALTACGGGASRTAHASTGHPTPADPDVTARQRVGQAMTTLLAGYDNATAHGDLRRGLAAQAAALHPASVSAPASASASAAPSPSYSSAPKVRTSDATLARGEYGLVQMCAVDLLDTTPELARLLAATAAGAAQRATLLGGRPPATNSSPALARLRPTLPELEALQAALGAEQAAVYGYGVLGAQLSGSRRALATTDYQLHRARRDTLVSLITAAGSKPVAAAAAYTLPFGVTDTTSAHRLAALMENRLAATYANAVQASDSAYRGEAATQLRLAALRALAWDSTPTPLPGLTVR